MQARDDSPVHTCMRINALEEAQRGKKMKTMTANSKQSAFNSWKQQ